MTRPYAEVIGDPIAHSKSPLIHNFWLQKLGIDAEYRACHVRAEELEDYFTRRREDTKWLGCNITIPHKVATLVLVHPYGDLVSRVGATNCVFRETSKALAPIICDNTDVEGVLAGIDAKIWQRDAGKACLIGAGGAARAAIYALRLAQADEINIVARNCWEAETLLAEFGVQGSVFSFVDGASAFDLADTVINATPLGMIEQPDMPLNLVAALSATRSDALVLDMVYLPLETNLLAQARELGRRGIDGLTMLIGQADEAFYLIFGTSPPREHDAELRALLTA